MKTKEKSPLAYLLALGFFLVIFVMMKSFDANTQNQSEISKNNPAADSRKTANEQK